jgi:hypothetical protein
MIFNPTFLKMALDRIRIEPDLQPTPDGSVTHCNQYCQRIAEDLGEKDLWGGAVMANDMIAYMDAHPEKFFKFSDHMKAWQMVNDGSLIFPAQREVGHGHLCPLRPSVGMETSGNWKAQVPFCSNVGKTVGIMGVNYAFRTPPDYYAVK